MIEIGDMAVTGMEVAVDMVAIEMVAVGGVAIEIGVAVVLGVTETEMVAVGGVAIEIGVVVVLVAIEMVAVGGVAIEIGAVVALVAIETEMVVEGGVAIETEMEVVAGLAVVETVVTDMETGVATEEVTEAVTDTTTETRVSEVFCDSSSFGFSHQGIRISIWSYLLHPPPSLCHNHSMIHREARLRWFGHAQRKHNRYIGRRILRMERPEKMNRGRPKRRFMDAVRDDMAVVEVCIFLSVNFSCSKGLII